jgi:hypothetical protein
MSVKRGLLPYGKNVWVFEKRERKKISPEKKEYEEKLHNAAFGNLYFKFISVIKLKRTR